MSTLSKSERDGLEDVFLSIHGSHNKLYKFKEVLALIISKKEDILVTLSKRLANQGLQKGKVQSFSNFSYKKKKNLSK